MPLKGDHRPCLQEEVIYRPHDMLQLFDDEVINDTVPRISNAVPCAAFRKFGLFVSSLSSSTPTTIHVEVEFLDRWTGQWYTHKQGPFAALFWEDTDTTPRIYECFVGDVLGRAIRVKLTGVGTTAGATFTVSIAVDLWN